MRLTKNFTLSEFTKSNTALRLGINNEPTKEGVIKLGLLAAFLQRIRDCIGPLRITSGYRSPQVLTRNIVVMRPLIYNMSNVVKWITYKSIKLLLI